MRPLHIVVSMHYNLTTMYTRKLSPPSHSFFLFGPRATGKTTWLRNSINAGLWINLLLDDELIPILTSTVQFRAQVDALTPGSWVVIDEVQKAPTLLNHIHDIISLRGDQIRFALTGSSARKLRRLDANLLAGRVIQRNFFPLTFSELGEQYSVDSAMTIGLLPGIVSQPTVAIEMLEAYVATYIKEEIRQEALVKDIASFSRFVRVSSLLNGQLLSLSNVARDAGVARATVERYFDILVDTLIAVRVPAWQPRAKVREVAQPKFYIFDCGVVRALQGLIREKPRDYEKGALLETLVLHELRAAISYLNVGGEIYHWRTSGGAEIDFVWQRGEAAIGIELKTSSTWRSDFGKSLRPLLKERKLTRGLVIYRGNHLASEQGVEGMPLESFLARLWNGEILVK
jgi:predicted AAA+ superfamily ATPase